MSRVPRSDRSAGWVPWLIGLYFGGAAARPGGQLFRRLWRLCADQPARRAGQHRLRSRRQPVDRNRRAGRRRAGAEPGPCGQRRPVRGRHRGGGARPDPAIPERAGRMRSRRPRVHAGRLDAVPLHPAPRRGRAARPGKHVEAGQRLARRQRPPAASGRARRHPDARQGAGGARLSVSEQGRTY